MGNFARTHMSQKVAYIQYLCCLAARWLTRFYGLKTRNSPNKIADQYGRDIFFES